MTRLWLLALRSGLCLAVALSLSSHAHAGPVFGAVQPVVELNSPSWDGKGSFSTDGLTIYFYSFRVENRGRIFSANRANLNSPFGTPSDVEFINVNYTPGTHNVGNPLISADGLTLIYGASNQIFSATRANVASAFGPGALVPNVNDIGGPESTRPDWLSSDGLSLYMSALRGDHWDMFVATRPTLDAPFGVPTEDVFTNINGLGSNFEAALTDDELQLFFASGRPGGFGDLDNWYATRPDKLSPFGVPMNLASINSAFSDREPFLFGATLFFTSTRSSGIYLDHDIFAVPIVPEPSGLTLAVFAAFSLLACGYRRHTRTCE